MGVYRCTVNMTQQASQLQNAWHLETTDPLTEAEIQTWVDGMITGQRDETSQTVTFNDIEYRRVDIADTVAQVYVPTGWPLTGANAGTELPSFCSILIKGTTLSGGKPNRFRKFLPGILETHVDGAVLNATGLANWGDVITDWQAFLDAQSDPQVVTVRYGDPAQAEDPRVVQAWNTVQNVNLSNIVRSNRSRRLGIGI